MREYMESNKSPATGKESRMRKRVKEIYDRQTARCLGEIEEMEFQLPSMVIQRFRKAIEFTAIDVDKMNNNTGGRDGEAKKETNWNH